MLTSHINTAISNGSSVFLELAVPDNVDLATPELSANPTLSLI